MRGERERAGWRRGSAGQTRARAERTLGGRRAPELKINWEARPSCTRNTFHLTLCCFVPPEGWTFFSPSFSLLLPFPRFFFRFFLSLVGQQTNRDERSLLFYDYFSFWMSSRYTHRAEISISDVYSVVCNLYDRVNVADTRFYVSNDCSSIFSLSNLIFRLGCK